MAKQSVQELLDDLRLVSSQNYDIVNTVRTLIMQTFDDVAEEVKYGGILFSSGVQFAGVFAYKAHISVEFRNGASIKDPFGFLEGTGKGRRHIKLQSVSQIPDKQLAEYLALALKASTEER